MTDNSTQQTETTTVNKPLKPLMTMQEMRRLKTRLEKLNLAWSDEHNNEMQRLALWLDGELNKLESIQLPPRKETAEQARAFLDAWTPSFTPNWITTRKGEKIDHSPITIISAFREEYSLVLNDRGEQTSLFNGNAPHKLTKAQERAWSNYYDLHPDARRYWLLFIGSYLNNVLEYLNSILPETVPYKTRGKPRGEDSARLEKLRKKQASAFYTGEPCDALAILLPYLKRAESVEDRIAETTLYHIKKTNVTLSMPTAASIVAHGGIGALKLFHVGLLILAEKNDYKADADKIDTSISITIEDYLKMCKRKTTKDAIDEARPHIKADLDCLYNLSCDWTTKSGRVFSRTRYLSHVAIKNSIIEMRFDKEMALYLISAFVAFLPTSLFSLSDRSPHAYVLGWKLWTHWGIDKNRKNNTHNIISVEAIIELYKGIADIEAIRASDRAATRRIITPIKRDLDLLSEAGIIKRWEWCGEKKRPLTDKELDQTYNELKNAYVLFEIEDFPDQAARLKRKAEKEKKAKEKQVAEKKNKQSV